MRHTRDKSYPAYKTRNLVSLACVIDVILHLVDTGVPFSYHGQHLFEANHLISRPLIAVERHVFDEADFEVILAPKLNERDNLSFVYSAHDDAINLQFNAGAKLIHFKNAVDRSHDRFM